MQNKPHSEPESMRDKMLRLKQRVDGEGVPFTSTVLQ